MCAYFVLIVNIISLFPPCVDPFSHGNGPPPLTMSFIPASASSLARATPMTFQLILHETSAIWDPSTLITQVESRSWRFMVTFMWWGINQLHYYILITMLHCSLLSFPYSLLPVLSGLFPNVPFAPLSCPRFSHLLKPPRFIFIYLIHLFASPHRRAEVQWSAVQRYITRWRGGGGRRRKKARKCRYKLPFSPSKKKGGR